MTTGMTYSDEEIALMRTVLPQASNNGDVERAFPGRRVENVLRKGRDLGIRINQAVYVPRTSSGARLHQEGPLTHTGEWHDHLHNLPASAWHQEILAHHGRVCRKCKTWFLLENFRPKKRTCMACDFHSSQVDMKF